MNAINIIEEHVFKSNLCTVCKNYCFTIKKVNHIIPHCTDCYKNVVNGKRKEQRKQKKLYTCEVCGEFDYEEVGLSTGENGVEKRVCGRCDIGCLDYNGWGDKEKPCKCTDAMDIRGRCGIGKVGFAKCPAFADTACFCICNDSDLDMKIRASEDLGINCTPIINQWLSDHNVPADLHEPILNLYNEWRVDEYESPNVYPYKECSECGERKSCGSYCDTTWFCEDCAEEEEEDCRTKPCSCGCGVLGGSCDRGVAIDNGEEDSE